MNEHYELIFCAGYESRLHLIEENTKPGAEFPIIQWEGIKQNGIVEITDADDPNALSMRFKIEVRFRIAFTNN